MTALHALKQTSAIEWRKNNSNNTGTIFMVLLSWIRAIARVHMIKQDSTRWLMTFGPSQPTWAISPHRHYSELILILPPHRGEKAESTCVAGYKPRQFTCPQAVTHPSSNRARCQLSTLIESNALITTPLHETIDCLHQHSIGYPGDSFTMKQTQQYIATVRLLHTLRCQI